jgi:DNA-binding transcriptional LysR family regulator
MRRLKYAAVLAEKRDRVRAAAELDIAPSDLMSEIKSLEEQLEMRIFCLVDGEVTMTDDGRMFLRACRAFVRIRTKSA